MKPPMLTSLQDRVAIVTGASRGLGAAIATSLAEAGCRVAVNYWANRERADALCADLRSQGLAAQAFRADVRDAKDVASLFTAVRKAFGEPDIVVANATAHQPMLAVEDQTWQAYLDQLEFFVKSPLLLMQAALPHWRAVSHGRFIQIGSEVVELGNPRFANYVAAKAAQLGQTRSWARELGPEGITVNLVAPGWIPTERTVEESDDARRDYLRRVPLGAGTASDVGAAVAYLASDAAAFITGQKLSINGGNTLE